MASSVYGVTGTDPPDDVYCEFCYEKVEDWFMNNPLGCYKCDDGINNPDAKTITKQEMRNRKLDLLSDEQ